MYCLIYFFSASFPKDSSRLVQQNETKGFIYITDGTTVANMDLISFEKESPGNEKKKLTQAKRKPISANHQSLKVETTEKVVVANKKAATVNYVMPSSSDLLRAPLTEKNTAVPTQNQNDVKKYIEGTAVFTAVFNRGIENPENELCTIEFVYYVFIDTESIRPPPFNDSLSACS